MTYALFRCAMSCCCITYVKRMSDSLIILICFLKTIYHLTVHKRHENCKIFYITSIELKMLIDLLVSLLLWANVSFLASFLL